MQYSDRNRIPDHPVIRNMEAFGTPDGRAEPVLRCPVCGCEDCFQVYRQSAKNAAPFVIQPDGSFLATAENGPEIAEEITDTIRWFGRSRVNPIFA